MTVEDVQERLAEIAALARDDEAAHSAEDRLHFDVLRAIEYGAENAADLAAAALETNKIEFSRWYA